MGTPPRPHFQRDFKETLGENRDPIRGPRAGHWYALIYGGPEFENFSDEDEQQEYNYHEEDQQQFELAPLST